MSADYTDLARHVLDLACRQGAGQGEVYLIDEEELIIEVVNQQVENLKIAQDRGLGLRVLAGQRPGYAYTSDLSPAALAKVAESAVKNAAYSQADEHWELPKPGVAYPRLELFDAETFSVPLAEKIRLAQNMEEAARAVDPRIKITQKSVYFDSRYSVNIFNTEGIAASYSGSYCGAYIVVVAQDGSDSQSGFEQQLVLKFSELKPEETGEKAGRKAIRMLGAKSIASGRMPVILEPYTASRLLGLLPAVFSGDAVLKGKSFWQGRAGQQVASSLLTIVDDGALPGQLGSAPFDGEGVATGKTVLLEKGILQGFLHNTFTANKLGVKPTGNGVRGSYKGAPEVGITNFYLQNGTASVQEIYRDISKGLLVTELMGLHTANPITGDFSLGASGLLIENGQLTKPIRGILLAGNLQEVLRDVEAVGNDLTLFGNIGSPTIRFGAMSVSGN